VVARRERERERERDSLHTRISLTFAAAVVLLNKSPTPITGERVSAPVADFHSVNSSLVVFPGRQQTLGLRILPGVQTLERKKRRCLLLATAFSIESRSHIE